MFWLGWMAFAGWLLIDPGWHRSAQDRAYYESTRAYLDAPAGRCHWTADPHRPRIGSPAVLCFQRAVVR